MIKLKHQTNVKYMIYKANLRKLSKAISHLNLCRGEISRTLMAKEFQSLVTRLEKD